MGTKCPWGQNVCLGQIYQGLARQFSLIKSIEHEGKIRQYPPSLSVGGWGKACTVLNNTEVLYIYQNSLHPYHVTLLKCTILHLVRLG
jgi:hypothetical protein